MVSSGMLRRVALVRTDVSEELSASFIRVTRTGELPTHAAKKYLAFLRSVRRLLVTASVVPSSQILVTLMKEATRSSETSVLTRATRRNIPEDTILLFLCKKERTKGHVVSSICTPHHRNNDVIINIPQYYYTFIYLIWIATAYLKK
jgi:hypothetical protein